VCAGCKIKELRAKTNTYIKTPVRGEEPVFIVTGRKEDVARAEAEIKMQSQHFSEIRANRQQERSKTAKESKAAMIVRVPMNLVGLVVGLKGATIKKIQDDSDTYIQTPQRPSQQPLLPSTQCKPDFTVRGSATACMRAEEMIRLHIETRTSTTVLQMNQGKQEPDYAVYANFSPASGEIVDQMFRIFPSSSYGPLSSSLNGSIGSGESLPSPSSLTNGHLMNGHDFLPSPPGLSNGGSHFHMNGGGSAFNGFPSPGLTNGFGSNGHALTNGALMTHKNHFSFNGFDNSSGSSNGLELMAGLYTGKLPSSQGSSASSGSTGVPRRGSVTLSSEDIFNRTCSQIDFGCSAGPSGNGSEVPYSADDGDLLRLAMLPLSDFQLPPTSRGGVSKPVPIPPASSAFTPVSSGELTPSALSAFMPLYKHHNAPTSAPASTAATASTGSSSPTSGVGAPEDVVSCTMADIVTQHALSEEDEQSTRSSSRSGSTSNVSSSHDDASL
jgi:hypothetical protein